MPQTGLIPDSPMKLQQTKLRISSELHSQLKSKKNKKVGTVIVTDDELIQADVVGASLPPVSYFLPCCPIQNQGMEGACAAFGTVYARNIDWYNATKATSYSTSTNQFSQEYVYNHVKFWDCAGGTSITACLDFIKNNGVVLYDTLPYDDSNGCSITATAEQIAEAAMYKIAGYTKSLKTDRTLIKNMVLQNKGVIFTYSTDTAWTSANASFIWSAATASNSGGIGHTGVIVGWDDAKKAWKVTNSWGTAWGDSGFGWIDYDFFDTKAGNYVFTLDGIAPSNTAPVANAGSDVSTSAGSTAVLEGSATDSNGYIKSWAWSQVSGPNTATIGNAASPVANVTNLVAGTYVFMLTVTDDADTSSTDTVTVNVTAVDVFDLTVTKSSVKGKTSDNLKWQISTASPIGTASLEMSSTGTGNWSTVYAITPYAASGTFSWKAPTKGTRYYRLKVILGDGLIKTSAVKSIK